jgi:hypothetical protein
MLQLLELTLLHRHGRREFDDQSLQRLDVGRERRGVRAHRENPANKQATASDYRDPPSGRKSAR